MYLITVNDYKYKKITHAGLVLTVLQNHLFIAISHFLQGRDNDSKGRGDNELFSTLVPKVLHFIRMFS